MGVACSKPTPVRDDEGAHDGKASALQLECQHKPETRGKGHVAASLPIHDSAGSDSSRKQVEKLRAAAQEQRADGSAADEGPDQSCHNARGATLELPPRIGSASSLLPQAARGDPRPAAAPRQPGRQGEQQQREAAPRARSQPQDTASAEELAPYVAHNAYALGAPRPPCHDARQRTAEKVFALRQSYDGEIESMLRLMCTVFNCASGNVALLDGSVIMIDGGCGSIAPGGVVPERWGYCGWSFLNSSHELLVVEDALQDKRFSENFFVTAEDYQLRFYIAAPLVASNNHRLGTLCVYGHEPGVFDATKASVLANLAEMLVRQIERKWAEEEVARGNTQLMRSLDAHNTALLFVDATSDDWRVLHMNKAAIDQIGYQWLASYDEMPSWVNGRRGIAQAFCGISLWDVFQLQLHSAEPTGKPDEFVLLNVHRQPGLAEADQTFTLYFRPASTSDGIDEHAIPLGVPSNLPDAPGFARHKYIVTVLETTGQPMLLGGDAKRAALAAELAAASVVLPSAGPFEGLQLGALLGKGSYGKVYRGLCQGRMVAVKVISDMATVKCDARGVPLEAALTQDLQHIGINSTIKSARHQPQQQAGSQPPVECWMILQYCDRGCFNDAVVKGWFRTSRLPTQGCTDYRAVAVTAYEIAAAMTFLHSNNVIHGDLTGGNVLLTSSEVALHGFAARVADFGLARNMDAESRVESHQYGTVTHMPPEVLIDGILSQAADVYAWGVLCWEALTGQRAYAGMLAAQIICAVAVNHRTLHIPEETPPELAELVRAALDHDMDQRPPFREVTERLARFLQLSCGQVYGRRLPAAAPAAAQRTAVIKEVDSQGNTPVASPLATPLATPLAMRLPPGLAAAKLRQAA